MTGGDGVPESSPRRDRRLRALVVLLVVLSLGSVLALVLLARGAPPATDVPAVRDEVLDLDRRAEMAYVEASKWSGSGPAAGEELAGRVERQVLPLLRAARRTAETIPDVPAAHRPLAETLRAYTVAREAAYVALVEALRTASVEATVAAKTRGAEADRLRQELKTLGEWKVLGE